MALIKTSEDLRTQLRDVQNGERILLGEGVFEGEFTLKKDNVEIVGQGTGKSILKEGQNKTCLNIFGNGCTISGLSIILEGPGGFGIRMNGSRNTIRDVKVSGSGTRYCIQVSGDENRLERLHISNSNCGLIINGSKNLVDCVKMKDMANVGITLGDCCKESIVQNVTGSNLGTGIFVSGPKNNFFNIHLTRMSERRMIPSYGMVLYASVHSSRISDLTCAGYLKDEEDLGLDINASNISVKDSDCGPVCVDGRNATLSRVNCGEVIQIGRKAKGVTLKDCSGQELQSEVDVNDVILDNCYFGA